MPYRRVDDEYQPVLADVGQARMRRQPRGQVGTQQLVHRVEPKCTSQGATGRAGEQRIQRRARAWVRGIALRGCGSRTRHGK